VTSRVRVGLVGTGLIAQVMHLHYLAELADRYEVAAVCDLDAAGARACAERYGIPAVFADWHDLLGHPLDAVLVLTSGSHAPIAEAAARAGRHVFVEKPMCFSAEEGRTMVMATSRRSTPRPAPTSRRHGRSSGYSTCPMSGCAWRPGT
jgi:predicted dehydrogenase